MKQIGILLGTGVLGYFAFEDAFKVTVPTGKKVLIYDTLKSEFTKEYDDGSHFINPIYEKVESVSLEPNPIKVTTLVHLSDKIAAEVTYEGKYRLAKHDVRFVYTKLGVNYSDRFLPSLINEIIGSSMKSFTSTEVLREKQVIIDNLPKDITKYSHNFKLILEEGKITRIDVYNQSEENKSQ